MDKIIRATAADGFAKMAVIHAGNLVEKARAIHGCTPTAAAALGRTLCAASLLGNAMKEEDAALTIRIHGGGPIGSIIAVSDCEGNVRGCVSDASVDPPRRPDGKLNVGAAVGTDGMLTVSRDIGLRTPYIGSTELVSGEIAEDITRYLTESEQIPSACALGVLVNADGTVRAAGGFLVQLMPGAPDELIDTLEENIFMMDQLTLILSEDDEQELFRQVLKGLDPQILEESPVEYRCPCSPERMEEALTCIDKQDLAEMIDAGEDIEVCCDFCASRYVFTVNQLKAIAVRKMLTIPAVPFPEEGETDRVDTPQQ